MRDIKSKWPQVQKSLAALGSILCFLGFFCKTTGHASENYGNCPYASLSTLSFAWCTHFAWKHPFLSGTQNLSISGQYIGYTFPWDLRLVIIVEADDWGTFRYLKLEPNKEPVLCWSSLLLISSDLPVMSHRVAMSCLKAHLYCGPPFILNSGWIKQLEAYKYHNIIISLWSRHILKK